MLDLPGRGLTKVKRFAEKLLNIAAVIPFFKYHGAGNDFVVVDDRAERFDTTDQNLVARMCDRHFGIGADGLMLLRGKTGYDFEMVYFNADGRLGSMCGNGGRCLVSFASSLGLVSGEASFLAADGEHKAVVHLPSDVSLRMIDVHEWEELDAQTLLLNTGSPHYVTQCADVAALDLVPTARAIRYSERFREAGVNVNFVQRTASGIKIRTYERGVEDETLACGTGITAAAIAAHRWGWSASPVAVDAVGGHLKVSFDHNQNTYINVWKRGPVEFVFQGNFSADKRR